MKLGMNASARPSNLCKLKELPADLAEVSHVFFWQLTCKPEGSSNATWSFEIYIPVQYLSTDSQY